MTVKQLIEFLQTQDQNLVIGYEIYSEHQLMELEQIEVKELQPARPDGWIHDVWGAEPKLPTEKYLIFPGN